MRDIHTIHFGAMAISALIQIARELSGIDHEDLTKAEKHIVDLLVERGIMVYATEPGDYTYHLASELG